MCERACIYASVLAITQTYSNIQIHMNQDTHRHTHTHKHTHAHTHIPRD